jgi:hypothetical protein
LVVAGLVLIWFDSLRPPTAGELAGTYVPKAGTEVPTDGGGEAGAGGVSLRLDADGTCVLRNMPDAWLLDSHLLGARPVVGGGGRNSATGTWTVDRDPGMGPSVRLRLTATGDYTPATRLAHGDSLRHGIDVPLQIRGSRSPYALRVWLGDPDEGRAADFVRQ